MSQLCVGASAKQIPRAQRAGALSLCLRFTVLLLQTPAFLRSFSTSHALNLEADYAARASCLLVLSKEQHDCVCLSHTHPKLILIFSI